MSVMKDQMTTTQQFADLYPFPAIRCRRISRLEERDLGDFWLTAENAITVGRQGIGIFGGNCGSYSDSVKKIMPLVDLDYPGRWIVAFSAKSAALEMSNLVATECGMETKSTFVRFRELGNCIFTTPEGLKHIKDEFIESGFHTVSGVIVVDPKCHIHKGRIGWNDRPQHVVNFMSDCSIGDWRPPLILLTHKPSKSINTNSMLSPYCLSTFWYVDAGRLRTGTPGPAICPDHMSH